MEFYGSNNKPEKRKESLIEKLQRVEAVGVLHLKGYSYLDIAEDQHISPATAKAYTDEYKEILKYQAEADPDFMDRVQENTLRFLKEFDEIGKETWETVRISTDAGMVTARVNALKLASEIAAQKARLLQLLGGKVDSSYVSRMQRAESVNQILSSIIAEIVSECDHCRSEAKIRLAEAFAIMRQEERALDAHSIESDVVEADIVDEQA